MEDFAVMDSMRMSHNKISVMILGNGKSLKKALITNILGRDISILTKRKILKNTVIYDGDTYQFTCTPDLTTTCDDIGGLFSKNLNFDLYLLVVEDGFSPEHVEKQIEALSKKTGKPREVFTVVLPLSYKSTDYPFKFCTLEQVCSKLSKLLKDKQLMPTNRKTRPAGSPEPQDETKKKRKHTEIKVNHETMTEENQEDQMRILNALTEVTSSPESKKTEKPTEDMKDNQGQTEQQVKSCTKDQNSGKEKKLLEDKKLGQQNKRSDENLKLQHEINTKGKHTEIKVNLVLLGLAGTGKSASGNTILRKKHFISKPSSNQVTTACQVEETVINSLHVRVIDTPDIFDDVTEPSVRDKHVKRCKELCESEPCVYVLVMHVSRFTDGERDVLKKLENTFGIKVKEKTVILFTRGDDLQEADMSLQDFINSCQPGLKEIIEKCGNRCVVFENRSSNSDQVEKLINTVKIMLKKTAKIE